MREKDIDLTNARKVPDNSTYRSNRVGYCQGRVEDKCGANCFIPGKAKLHISEVRADEMFQFCIEVGRES